MRGIDLKGLLRILGAKPLSALADDRSQPLRKPRNIVVGEQEAVAQPPQASGPRGNHGIGIKSRQLGADRRCKNTNGLRVASQQPG